MSSIAGKREDYRYLQELEFRIKDAFYQCQDEAGRLRFDTVVEEFREATNFVENFKLYVSRNPAVTRHLEKMANLEKEMADKGIGYSILEDETKKVVRLFRKSTLENIHAGVAKVSFMSFMVADGISPDDSGFWLTFAGHCSTMNESLALFAYRNLKEGFKNVLSH